MSEVKDFLREKLNEELKRKLYKTGSSEWIVIKIVKPSEKTKKSANLPDNFRYWVMFNTKTGEFKCDCLGYIVHKKCKHIEYFRSFFNSSCCF